MNLTPNEVAGTALMTSLGYFAMAWGPAFLQQRAQVKELMETGIWTPV